MIAKAHGSILDQYGEPIARRISPPVDLVPPQPTHQQKRIAATYDAARESGLLSNYWADADNNDADSANSQTVRRTLVSRARHEVANNGFVDGMTQTHANFLVGCGPSLRMQTSNPKFNAAVEAVWNAWSTAICLRRKLWCMAHAKTQDGEALAICGTNQGVKHRIKLDLRLIETEQCQSDISAFGEVGYCDGIKFDEFGNPESYDILPYHPGGTGNQYSFADSQTIPAAYVLHWFTLRRPGQHRGVPEFRSTLNVGAQSRAFREATIGAAQAAARQNLILETQLNPDAVTPVVAMSNVDLPSNGMTAMPIGWKMSQIAAQHPNATYESFNRGQLNETARPKSIPLNVAACDSSQSNFASGKLDYATWFATLDVERGDGNDLVLDKLFELFFDEAVLEYGWNSPEDAQLPAHSWGWPKHPTGDIKAESISRDFNLRNGSTHLAKVYADSGLDFEDELVVMAKTYFGDSTPKSVLAMRALLRGVVFSGAKTQDVTEFQVDENGDPILDENGNPVPVQAGVVTSASEQLKAEIDAYGVGVRAGTFTPQTEDEDYFRKSAGLPSMSANARTSWTAEKGVRRPITLTPLPGQSPAPFQNQGAPANEQ